MSYHYADYRGKVLTDDGQRDVIRVLEQAQRLFDVAGCATYSKLTAPISGDSWRTMAIVDRCVELEKLRRLSEGVEYRADDVYVPGSKWPQR